MWFVLRVGSPWGGPPPKSIAGARSVHEMSTAAVAAWGPPLLVCCCCCCCCCCCWYGVPPFWHAHKKTLTTSEFLSWSGPLHFYCARGVYPPLTKNSLLLQQGVEPAAAAAAAAAAAVPHEYLWKWLQEAPGYIVSPGVEQISGCRYRVCTCILCIPVFCLRCLFLSLSINLPLSLSLSLCTSNPFGPNHNSDFLTWNVCWCGHAKYPKLIYKFCILGAQRN